MSTTFHLASSGEYQSELKNFKLRNGDNKLSLFGAVSEFKNLTTKVLETYMEILVQLECIDNDLERKINEIIEMRDVVEWLFHDLSGLLQQRTKFTPVQSQIGYLISELEQIIFIKIPNIEINWDSKYNPRLGISYNPYRFRNYPIWTNGRKGKEENTFSFPCDLAIDSITGMIYAVDYQNCEIYVYDKYGQYKMKFKDSSVLKGPRKLALQGKYLYVIVETDVILKFNCENGSLLDKKKLNFFIGGIDSWEDKLYGGDYGKCIVHVMNESFVGTQTLSIDATEKSGIQYVKARENGLYLLFKSSKNWLQKFSYTGALLSTFSTDDFTSEVWFFNLDLSNNIIITASKCGLMRIYNPKGELLKSYGDTLEDSVGTIITPRGVVLTQDYRIIVLCLKEKHCLQCF
ncbi:hypothetical protein LOD99_12671 [Oopsacas minuta]|uniref:Uncharacterized protein n=1 Tax=Oopsacas minuta TaxID=111878 RepID=A0AAV7JDK4_9METZ|nr:hypothetical protein LOD99_12671 [Oopsacas minuta]